MRRSLSALLALVAACTLNPRDSRAAPGHLLLGELNCTACHAPTERQSAWLSPKTAPRLTDLASRTSAAWLQHYLAAPHESLPATTMPDVLHALPPAERAAAAEALTHHLLSPARPPFRRVMPDRAAVARGEGLYHRVGCVACHAPQNPATNVLHAVALPRMAEKWSLDGLRRFLRDPLALRPAGRMPALQLTDAEAADLAHYLLRETKVPAPLEVAHFRGRVRSLDELDAAELARTGPAQAFNLDAMGRDRGYALRFSGWLQVERAGDYTFHFAATGASRLAIDGKWLAGEDSWRREKVEAKIPLPLAAGLHAVTVDYVQRGPKDPALKLEWEGPGVPREIIPSIRLRSEREPGTEPPPFPVDPAKAAHGRALYAELNCAACHDPQPSPRPTPALAALQPARGCLAETPPATAPNFHLAPAQRAALRESLASLNAPNLPAPSPQQRVAHTLSSLYCLACHARDGVGGVPPDRDAFFTSNGDDLGDEGRLPPKLDGVGDRLRPAWLSNVLAQGVSVRPYFNTRMPQFGATNVSHLADLFVALDRRPQPLTPVPASDTPDAQRDAGRKLTGTDGLSCIACHRFNHQPAHALQVIDLTTTAERLNEDWFRQFLRDPNRFHPATRMPAFWPDGKSLLPALLGGDTDRQHAALWTYFADGPRAKFPEGLSRQNLELIVGGEAVVYRGKLWEAGFRAVAVGYPGQLNAAFDAEEMRLALLWRGRFLNVGAHWGSQGMGQIRPLGTEVVVFPHGPPLAVLADANAPWPGETSKAPGLKFRGYQIDPLKRPTLLYAFQNVGVEDFLTPSEADGKAALRRLVRFTDPPPDGLHFRLATGKLTPSGDNTWRLDNTLTLRVHSSTPPILRGDGDQQELLLPVRTRDGKTQLEVEYVW